jgi:predicted transcriptional regulator
MRRTKKLGPVSIRLDPDVRRGIEEMAEADERSLSAYINRVLRRHLEAEHPSWPEAKAKR